MTWEVIWWRTCCRSFLLFSSASVSFASSFSLYLVLPSSLYIYILSQVLHVVLQLIQMVQVRWHPSIRSSYKQFRHQLNACYLDHGSKRLVAGLKTLDCLVQVISGFPTLACILNKQVRSNTACNVCKRHARQLVLDALIVPSHAF